MNRPKPAIAAYCVDAPNSAEARLLHLNARLEHVETIMDKLLIAGPLKDEAGAFTGSLIIFAVGEAAEAEALIERDPYRRAGVWKEVRLEPFLPVAGTLIGGRSW
jgi:uncharacterized protein YciI